MRALIQRLAHGVVIVAIVATITFLLVHLAPGDPFAAALENARVTPALRQQWRAAYGMDGNIASQYHHWLTSLARGDLGWSVSRSEPVGRSIMTALPYTLLLMSVALTLAFALGMLLGALQAARRGRALDHGIGAVALVGASLPDFWLALVVLLMGSYWWRLFPVGGATDPLLPASASLATIVLDRVHHLVLPTLTLVLLIASPVARQQRVALLERLGADWVRTATAKGVTPTRVFWRHAWRTALIPIVTLGGLALPALVGGAVFVERVFAWPGMGLLAAGAIAARDYQLVVGCVMAGAVMVVVGSIVADLVTLRLDPRSAGDGSATRTP